MLLKRSIRGVGLSVFAVMVFYLLTDCAFFELKGQLFEMKATFGLNGKIFNDASDDIPVVTVLYRVEKDLIQVFDYSLPDPAGHYSFLVPEGVYYIAAFGDLNCDFTYNEGERYGYANASQPIHIDAKQMVRDGKGVKANNIYLKRTTGYRPDLPTFVDISTLSGKSWLKVGVVTSLNDPIFAQENGYMGCWKPLSFLRQVGVGIYFIEPYSPLKTPILFVHGTNGTPIGFKPIVEKMDRSRYQAWFYYYPSGVRIDAIAGALNNMVKSLHDNLGFDKLVIAGHSTGGLVSRAFILKNAVEDSQPYIKKLITLSTPWGGVKTAQIGVKNAPVVMPSWYDLSPDSEFISYLYNKSLPDHVQFYLMFGIRGNFSMMMANNDGTIEIASEIDHRAQRDSVHVFPFDEDHDSILASKIVIEKFHQLLE